MLHLRLTNSVLLIFGQSPGQKLKYYLYYFLGPTNLILLTNMLTAFLQVKNPIQKIIQLWCFILKRTPSINDLLFHSQNDYKGHSITFWNFTESKFLFFNSHNSVRYGHPLWVVDAIFLRPLWTPNNDPGHLLSRWDSPWTLWTLNYFHPRLQTM